MSIHKFKDRPNSDKKFCKICGVVVNKGQHGHDKDCAPRK